MEYSNRYLLKEGKKNSALYYAKEAMNQQWDEPYSYRHTACVNTACIIFTDTTKCD
jgi:hypothetical protein